MTEGSAARYRAARELVTPQRLREFFAPRSIALVGASDNSGGGPGSSWRAARRRASRAR